MNEIVEEKARAIPFSARLRCWLGIHRFFKWSPRNAQQLNMRICMCCGLIQTKKYSIDKP